MSNKKSKMLIDLKGKKENTNEIFLKWGGGGEKIYITIKEKLKKKLKKN